MEPEEIGNEV